MIVSEKMASSARLTLMSVLSDEELEQHDSTILCMTVEKVAALYHAAAKRAHPDAGGTSEKFAAVDRAKHVLLAWLARPAKATPTHRKQPCDYCGGAGYVHTSTGRPGAAGLRRQCRRCHGSGDADYDAT